MNSAVALGMTGKEQIDAVFAGGVAPLPALVPSGQKPMLLATRGSNISCDAIKIKPSKDLQTANGVKVLRVVRMHLAAEDACDGAGERTGVQVERNTKSSSAAWVAPNPSAPGFNLL